jgi:iron(III) transport system substrate-binding protein
MMAARVMTRQLIGVIATLGLLGGCTKEPSQLAKESEQLAARSDPLVVYVSHDAARTASVLDAYRSDTGTKYRLMSDDMPEQAARLGNPQLMPKADLFVAGSLAELWSVAESDALRPVYSEALANNIDPAMRDPESRWVALASRGRIVVYNTGQVSAQKMAALQDYTSLGDEAWRDSLCVASSAVPGNRSLIAFLIRRLGVRDAEIAVRRWRDNLAATVFVNDEELLRAVSNGQCTIGIADSNVLAELKNMKPDTPVAAHWFDAPDNTFFDISGAGVTRHAADPDGATALLEWLTTAMPNALFATRDFEFPANPEAPAGAAIEGWSQHVPEPASLADIAFQLEEAARLVERARYP